MPLSVPPTSGALNMSLSETSMSMPDLTMSLSDPTVSPSWISDIEDQGVRAHGTDRRLYRHKEGRKNQFSSLLGSQVALTGQAEDVHSMTSIITSSYADTSSARLPFTVSRASRREVKSPTLATSASLRDSLESSATSWASSGAPGPGYYSGKAIKWLGQRSLDAVDSVITLRHTYRHLARLKRWKKQGRTDIAAQHQDKVFEMLEDALEMSRPCYSSLVNKAAEVIARAVDDWIIDHFAGPNTKETDAWLSQIHVCLSPMRLARSHHNGARPSDDLFRELLSAVTKVPLSLQPQDTTSTVILVLARELTQSLYGTHHRWIGESLRRIVKQTQQTRPLTEEEMSALCSIAMSRFQRGEEGESCRPWEVVLFAECVSQSSQSQWCMDVVEGPRGLQSLVSSLEITGAKPVFVPTRDEEWFNIDDILASLLSLSRHAWLRSSFASTPGFLDLLLRILRRGTRERRFRSCTCIIFTLRNVTAHQPSALHTPEATSALVELAEAAVRRGPSSEEYYRKIAWGYAREMSEDAGDSSIMAEGIMSEA